MQMLQFGWPNPLSYLPAVLLLKVLWYPCLAVVPTSHTQDIVSLGNGSYATTCPEACEDPQNEIYKVASLKGPTPTNQWWSSLVWSRYSANMFPHPLGAVCFEGGFSISYPGSGLVAVDKAIVGGGVSKLGDIVIGHSATDQFPDAKLAEFSQWFITAEFAKDDSVLRCTFGHGSPYVFGKIQGGNPLLRFAHKPIKWAESKLGSIIGLTVRGNHYGLFGSKGSRWLEVDGNSYRNDDSQGYFSVALLPDNKPSTLERFARYAHSHVVNTEAIPRVNNGYLETIYRIETQPMEGRNQGTIFALYPHQWKYSDVVLMDKEYLSVRGVLKLAEGSKFKTKVPIQGVLPMLPVEGIPDRGRLLDYLKNEVSKDPFPYGDTYFEGKHLGKLASLCGIAESLGAKEIQAKFLDELKTRLENWFTVVGDDESPYFYYNDRWGTMIGSKPSFGSDSQINDHHFHYGYFIRAAAEVARQDSQWAVKWRPLVELLIRDIASTQRNDPLFPKMRCFDIYAGHSWACGHARFGDGNNQESSSESMNAWYGLMLWGAATGDNELLNTGLFLYNTERTAVEEYWFDVSDTNFPDDFPQITLGMVWGGKGSFETWFSAELEHIYGINWLPFTPASIYLGRFPEYIEHSYERLVRDRKNGMDYNNEWGDLIVMFLALCDPSSAAEFIDENPDCDIEAGNSHAFMYQWIHTLNTYGINDATVTANFPFATVLIKDGKRTYLVYNFSNEPVDVQFSSGTTLSALPKTLTFSVGN